MISSLELARICGVSQGTVDRALKGRAGIRESTKRKVLQAAAKHGYRPNPAAREILTGRSRIVQAVFPTANNLFFMDLAERLGRTLRAKNFQLQISLAGETSEFLAALEEAAARRHAMAVVIPPKDHVAIPASLARNFPIVSVLSPCRNIPFLSPNEEETGRTGVNHLVRMGHRRIAFLSSIRQAHAVAARAAGYRKQMADLGLPSKVIFSTREITRGTYRPTALFCHNDWIAVQAILSLRADGVGIPGDLSVLGVDHTPTLASLYPDLSSLAYPMEGLVSALLSHLGKTKPPNPDALRFVPVDGRSLTAPSPGGNGPPVRHSESRGKARNRASCPRIL